VRVCSILVFLAWLAGCATPLVQVRGERQTAPRLEVDRVTAADGVALPLSVWRPQGAPRAVVLALHGLNDYRHAFAEVGPFLAARGIATYAYDQRGFGATVQRGIWPGTALLVDDARTVAALLRQRYPGRPLYLLGESMGGAVAMSLFAETPEAADGAVLVAAAVWGRATMNPLQRAALWLLAHSLPGLRLSGRGLGITPSDNKAMLHALGEDPLVLKEARVDALWGMANLMDRALAAAPGLTVPALVLYGEHDEVIPRHPTCRMLSTLTSSVRVAVYPNGYHMLTRDLGAKVVLEDLAAWLADPAALLPSGNELDGLPTLCGRDEHLPIQQIRTD
ncbi:MAG TPA: alpha/beta hydrolase, partial [Aquabacterium sp.]|nr:alpha/beta hydrolase [Aquabacterium sp.]